MHEPDLEAKVKDLVSRWQSNVPRTETITGTVRARGYSSSGDGPEEEITSKVVITDEDVARERHNIAYEATKLEPAALRILGEMCPQLYSQAMSMDLRPSDQALSDARAWCAAEDRRRVLRVLLAPFIAYGLLWAATTAYRYAKSPSDTTLQQVIGKYGYPWNIGKFVGK